MSTRLRTRILLGYGVALCLIAAVLVLAFMNLFRLGHASEAILSENYRSIQAAEHMINALERQDSGVLLYLLGDEESGARQFHENRGELLRWLGRARGNLTIEGEGPILVQIDSAYARYLEEFARLVRRRAGSASTSGDLTGMYEERLHPTFLAVRQAIERLRGLNEATMFAASDRADAVARRAVWSLALGGLVAIGVGLAFSLILSHRLARPILDITEATARIAAGNYDIEVPARSGDELGELARRFNEMADRLRAYRDLNVGRLMAEKRKGEAIIRSIDDGLVVVDSELRVVDVNPAARRVLGHAGRELVGKPVDELIHEEAVVETLRRTVASGQPLGAAEQPRFLTSAGSGGESRHFDVVVAPVRGEAAGMTGAILMLRDVTKLRELDRMKSDFVATVSHELRTPLTSIAMSLDLLDERVGGRLDEQTGELLDGTRRDVERLRSLVRDLLDLSRIEAGRIDLDVQPVDTSLMIEKASEVMRPQALERGVHLRLDLPGGLPAVRADFNKVTWVLTNLVSNALRYSASGDRIELRAVPRDATVELAVADEGSGIPYEYQSRIFDKFVQVERNGGREGTGLGLAICREVVRAHGGSIWVESAPGEGSTFRFTLPVAD